MITVDTAAFASALKTVLPAVGRSHLPILAGVKIDVADGRLTVEASDLQTTGRVSVACGPGELTAVAPARVLTDVVSKMHDAAGLELRDGELIVEDANGGATLRTLAPGDWPRISVEPADIVAFDAVQAATIRSVLRGLSTEKTARPLLTGVRFEPGVVVATDSYRLFAGDLGADVPACTVPGAALKAALADHDTFSLGVTDRYARIVAGDAAWLLRLLEGEYPSWHSITAPGPVEIVFEAEPMLDRLARVAPLTSTKTQMGSEIASPVRLELADDQVTLSARSPDEGEVQARMAATCSEPLRIAFTLPFLRDLVAWAGETVRLRAHASGLKPVVATEGPRTAVLMPSRVPGWSTGC